MVDIAGIQDYFTHHSPRTTTATRLYQKISINSSQKKLQGINLMQLEGKNIHI